MSDLSVIFAGTPAFAAVSLEALVTSEFNVIAIYTQPDKTGKRKNQQAPRPVKELALHHGIDLFQPESLNNAVVQQQLAAHQADIMVVVAYGMLLPKKVLEIPRLGCINVHGSLLPRWRGAAPVERAMLASDSETGVTIMQMDAGLDTGDILLKASTPIAATDTAESLTSRLGMLGAATLLDSLRGLQLGEISPKSQQDSLATYANKLDKKEGLINWQQSAQEIELKIRALSPRIAVTFNFKGQNIRILAAELTAQTGSPGEILPSDKKELIVACSKGSLKLTRLQLPGKKPLNTAEILNSKRDQFCAGVKLI